MIYIRKEISVILSIQVLYTKQIQTETKPERGRGGIKQTRLDTHTHIYEIRGKSRHEAIDEERTR